MRKETDLSSGHARQGRCARSPSKSSLSFDGRLCAALHRRRRRSAELVLPDGQGELVIADSATDGLWESTCFEAFLTEEASPIIPNSTIAPTAAGPVTSSTIIARCCGPDDLAPWEMAAEKGDQSYALRVEPGIFPDNGAKLALSAVIEEVDGTKSYWALAHPPGKPDFHHPDCFALTLGAPDAA